MKGYRGFCVEEVWDLQRWCPSRKFVTDGEGGGALYKHCAIKGVMRTQET